MADDQESYNSQDESFYDEDSNDVCEDDEKISFEKFMHLMRQEKWILLENQLRKNKIFDFDVNKIDEQSGLSVLGYAAKEARVYVSEKIIEQEANINLLLKDNKTALHLAVTSGKDDIVRLLLNKNASASILTSKNQLPLHLACGKPKISLSTIQLLVKVSSKHSRLKQDFDGLIPLHYSIRSSNYLVCRELLHTYAKEQLTIETYLKRETALHLACRTKNYEIIELLLHSGACVNSKNIDGQTPLHISSWEGDHVTVKLFYNFDANPNLTDNLDQSPVHLAAERGHNEVIKLLIDKFKCNYILRTKDGSTLMHAASEQGYQKTALLLLKKGVPLHMPNKSGAICLHSACRKGHVDVVKALLQNGSKVNSRTKENYTPLHVAVENCKYLVVQVLLGYGADVQIKGGKLEETPLHIAAKVSDSEYCAEMLLKSGANSDIENLNGETALHLACKHGQLKLVRILLLDGASPKKLTINGETCLHLAVRYIHYEIAQEILQHVERSLSRLDAVMLVNTPNNEGESVIHYVAEIEKPMISRELDDADIIKLLLDYDADLDYHTRLTQETAIHFCASSGNINVFYEISKRFKADKLQALINRQSKNGSSPLLVAAEKGNVEIIKLMLSFNARSDIFDENGKSALHLASEYGQTDVVDLLLDRKAFINAKTKNGFTALHLACQNGHLKLVKLLIERGSDIDALTLSKKTPLHLAALYGRIDVCEYLIRPKSLELMHAVDCRGQNPLHLAAENDHANVVKVLLKAPVNIIKLISSHNGNTCAHIASLTGSLSVLKELLKYNKKIIIGLRNKINQSNCLQLATSGGYNDAVKLLLEAGSNPMEENQDGMTPIHIAAKFGHTDILRVLANYMSLDTCSKMTGLTALHIGAFYGRAEFCRQMLERVQADTSSQSSEDSHKKLGEIRLEAGLTPLHLASLSGHEGLIRLLLNSPNVNVDAATANSESIALHFAAESGHILIAGLLLSKQTSQLHYKNKFGRTALHLAANNGHSEMCTLLISQGAHIASPDKIGWTPLHYASMKGHLNVATLLVESGALTDCETNEGKLPIYYAAQHSHITVVEYLLEQKYDEDLLTKDNKFLKFLIECGKNTENSSLKKFILSSEAPVYLAVKLSAIYTQIAEGEKEIAKDILETSEFCENIAIDLVSIVSTQQNIEQLLKAQCKDGQQFVDILIQCVQKGVLSHVVVQQYFTDVWDQNLKMSSGKISCIFFAILLMPPLWLVLSLPFPIRNKKLNVVINRVPMIKFMCYLISHLYLIILLFLTSVSPLIPIPQMESSIPAVHEWLLLAWLSGLLASELISPSDKGGLGLLKIVCLVTSTIGCICHASTLVVPYDDLLRYELFYARNVFFGITILFSFIQILDFLTINYIFGPWSVILREIIKDLIIFIVILLIFLFGFTCMTTTVYQEVYPSANGTLTNSGQDVYWSLREPKNTIYFMYVTLFGLTSPPDLPTLSQVPVIGFYAQKIIYGLYSLTSAIVLITLLVATMTDTYERIQEKSDIEWKYGRAKLIRDMASKSSNPPSPLNLFTKLFRIILALVKFKGGIFNADAIDYIDTSESIRQDNPSKKTSQEMEKQQQITNENMITIEKCTNWRRIIKIYLNEDKESKDNEHA